MMKSYGLSQDTLNALISVFDRHGEIRKVILYGSRAKGNFKKGSDIDLTLAGKDLTWDKVVCVEEELDDLLLPYKLDISCLEQLNNTELIDHIKRVGKVLYQRKTS
jgi:predicted nucleotidyltransferase